MPSSLWLAEAPALSLDTSMPAWFSCCESASSGCLFLVQFPLPGLALHIAPLWSGGCNQVISAFRNCGSTEITDSIYFTHVFLFCHLCSIARELTVNREADHSKDGEGNRGKIRLLHTCTHTAAHTHARFIQ